MTYPFSPDLLERMPEELAQLYRNLEITLLKEICSRLKISEQLNEVTMQDIKALRSYGISMEEIKKAIQQAAGISAKKLDKLLNDAVERNQQYYTELIDIAGVTAPEYLISELDISAIIRQTQDELRNIARSMGFLVDSGRTMLPPAKAYQWALDNAVMQIESGAINYQTAISNAALQLSASGLKVVNYESGHTDQADVAVRRAIMTGVNQLNQKYREQSMEYLGTDLVEVTAHLGARNIQGPNGWEAHTVWQGKVYRWRDKPHTSTGEYPDFEASCGLGSVTGIGGANCRHSYFPFVEGVSKSVYTDAQLESMKPENRAKILFDGKEYDDYQATQFQRRMERTVRKLKRDRAALQAVGDTEKEQAVLAKTRALTAKYREFSKAAGLPTQFERMVVRE